MYFAVSPTAASVPEQIARALSALRGRQAGKPLYLLALVDGAFDEALIAEFASSPHATRSLYEGTSLQSFGHAAPHLLIAPHEPSEHLSWLQHCFATCAGKPMLSILASAVPAAGLQIRFRSYLTARTPDGMEWPLRWADTRVLPSFLEVLEPAQRAHLLAPLYSWWGVQRNGNVIQWQGEGSSRRRMHDFDKLALSETAFGELVDRAEADAVLADIHDLDPAYLQNHLPVQCHARVSTHLALASEHGITSAPDRLHFSLLALSLQADFAQHPAMKSLLQRTRTGADYQTEIAALPPIFWQTTAAT